MPECDCQTTDGRGQVIHDVTCYLRDPHITGFDNIPESSQIQGAWSPSTLLTRTSREELHLRTAELWQSRSTCKRASVGALVTDLDGRSILGFGYNGNARHLPNTCDTDIAGSCGCLHAEINALLRTDGARQKLLFTTVAPCVMCAKAAINANVVQMFFRKLYRDPHGIVLLLLVNIPVVQLAPNGAKRVITLQNDPRPCGFCGTTAPEPHAMSCPHVTGYTEPE
jgi:deoxycytidylate deaminase